MLDFLVVVFEHVSGEGQVAQPLQIVVADVAIVVAVVVEEGHEEEMLERHDS